MERIVVFACITIFSLVLFGVSLLSYWKYKKSKLLLISGVFLIFLIRGILLSLSLFSPLIAAWVSSIYIWVFDLMILMVLYLTSLKR